ncbi:hypothetical protein HSX11_24205 [Oxalobacteraceae bacterium]|nr:hypothetical protein [Oxalobacteraceae bacterium]
MTVNAVTSSNTSAATVQATPLQQQQPVRQAADKPAENITPPAPPPPAASTPSVNTSGQKIGTTISTSA